MEKKKVFVIMPFQDEFFEVYEMLKMEFADSFEFSNAADEGNQQCLRNDKTAKANPEVNQKRLTSRQPLFILASPPLCRPVGASARGSR